MDSTLTQLEALYRELGPALLAYFRRHRALAAAAEDLLQDTFVRAFRGWDRLSHAASPRAYLFGIARHVSLDALRALRPTDELQEEKTALPAESPEDPRLEPMREAIATLGETHREALLLKLQHDLSYEEIAQVLDIPVGTVRSRLHHAVGQLRAILNPPPTKGSPS